MEAKAFQAPPEALAQFQLPYIAHVKIESGALHYVVVSGVTAQKVYIMDPGRGEYLQMGLETFIEQWTGIVIVVIPGERTLPIKTILPSMRIWLLARSQWKSLLPACIAAIAISILGILPAFAVSELFDGIIPESNTGMIHAVALILFVALCAEVALSAGKDLLIVRAGEHLLSELITNYYRKLFALPQSFFDTMRTGELISRIGDAARVSNFVARSYSAMLLSVLVIVFSAIITAAYSWRLAVFVFATLLIFSLLLYARDRYARKKQEELVIEEANFESTATEILQASGTVKKLAIESFAVESLMFALQRMLKKLKALQHHHVTTGVAALFFTRLLVVTVLWAGGLFVISGRMSTGELMSSYGLLIYFTAPLIGLLTSVSERRDALIAVDRLFEITDLEAERQGEVIPEGKNFFPVRIENVSFRYRNGPFILHGLSLEISEGQIVGITGKTGCGKSTIAALLQSIYPVTEGDIKMNGVNINEIDPRALRSIIACVPQQNDVFSGTLVENIAVGDKQPNMVLIESFAESVCLETVVDRLPDRWHNRITANASMLSGGEKQKICIARALYRNPRLLILDEATSALDVDTEERIMQTFDSYRQCGNSIIIIAHRPSALTICDKIIILENGQLK